MQRGHQPCSAGLTSTSCDLRVPRERATLVTQASTPCLARFTRSYVSSRCFTAVLNTVVRCSLQRGLHAACLLHSEHSQREALSYVHSTRNKPGFSFLRKARWQRSTARIRPTLLLSAGRAAIDRYLLPAGPTAANLQRWVCCCGPMLGQTDGRTGTVPLHRPSSAYYVGSANELNCSLGTLVWTVPLEYTRWELSDLVSLQCS